MTPVPLPESPCLRTALDYTDADGNKSGSRFFLGYAGAGPPTGADCTTLAGDVAAAWATHIAPQIGPGIRLTEVDVLDIATDVGLSGQWHGDNAGTLGGAVAVPIQIAVNVEFGLARRYRGGKPRMYFPPPTTDAFAALNRWKDTYVTAMNAAVLAFFGQVTAVALGSIGALNHVSISYHHGETLPATVAGERQAAHETLRAAGKVDQITGYFTKSGMSSQKRRRTAITY